MALFLKNLVIVLDAGLFIGLVQRDIDAGSAVAAGRVITGMGRGFAYRRLRELGIILFGLFPTGERLLFFAFLTDTAAFLGTLAMVLADTLLLLAGLAVALLRDVGDIDQRYAEQHHERDDQHDDPPRPADRRGF